RLDRRIARGEFAHLVENAEFNRLFANDAHAGETVGAQADVHTSGRQFVIGKRAMVEIRVAARAMNHVDLAAPEKRGIAGPEIIKVEREQIGVKRAVALEVLD